MRTGLAFFVCIAAALANINTAAQTRQPRPPAEWAKHVYRVEANCAGNKKYVSTAFKLQGEPALLTALHGVAGCDQFVVISSEVGVPIPKEDKVTLHWVNLDSDLAMLAAPSLGRRAADGLALGDPSALTAGQTLRSPGFAYSLYSTMESRLVATNDSSPKRLEQIIPPQPARPVISARGSPSLTAQALRLQGPLARGQSGGPILDGNERVIAVVNGGAGVSESSFVWGMILDKPAAASSLTAGPGWQLHKDAVSTERWRRLLSGTTAADWFYAGDESRAQFVSLEWIEPEATAHFFRTPNWAVQVFVNGRSAFIIREFTERANNVLRNLRLGPKRVNPDELAALSGGYNPTIITSCEVGSQIRVGVSLLDNLTADTIPYVITGETLLPCDDLAKEVVTDLEVRGGGFWNRAKFELRFSTGAYVE